MTVNEWQNVGIICGALLALFTLLGLVWRRGLHPMLKAVRRAVATVDKIGDEILGDRAKGIPSMADRVTAVEKRLAEHVDEHMPPLFSQHQGRHR